MKTARLTTAFFFHGFLGRAADWKPTLRHVEQTQTLDICCVDLWEDVLDCDSLSDWLDHFEKKNRAAAPFILCGYSMGARLAIALACRHPKLVRGLVVISGNPGLRSQKERAARLLDDRRWKKVFADEPWSRAIARWNERAVFHGHELRTKREWFSIAKLGAALEIFSLGKQPDFRGCLQKLDLPVLWIVGDNDLKFRKIAAESWIKNSTITVKSIPACGHRVPFEKPRELAQLLDAFCGSLGGNKNLRAAAESHE
ncbi:MAG TPA: alpha/beta fold hydrolase [Chthoniobacterales bacterium]|jgi:2-succinyl-6-hydroxy-2,4-cyclohexadiene-1-carboxylate synthase